MNTRISGGRSGGTDRVSLASWPLILLGLGLGCAAFGVTAAVAGRPSAADPGDRVEHRRLDRMITAFAAEARRRTEPHPR